MSGNEDKLKKKMIMRANEDGFVGERTEKNHY